MKIDKSLLSGTTVLLVLSLLQQEDQYGYQMIAALSARSDNVFQMKEGTLYPVLHTLEKQGHIKSYEKETPQGRKRKYYRLTAKGQRLLGEKAAEWKAFSQGVEKVVSACTPQLQPEKAVYGRCGGNRHFAGQGPFSLTGVAVDAFQMVFGDLPGVGLFCLVAH